MSRQPSGAGADRRQFLMGPIEKFLRHRRIPFKLIANVVLIVLLTCLVQLYVAPLQTALGKERHRLVEAILTLPTEDGLPDSYQSKWHGDYADTPRVAVVDSSGAAQYILHIPSLLRAESSDANVAIEVTFNEFSAATSGGMPLALSGLTVQWSSGLVNPINSSANSLLDIGLAMHHFLMESTNDVIKAALRSVSALTTIDCGATLPSSALCDGPNGYKMMCAPCVPPAWVALRNEDNGVDVRNAWAAMRLVQYVSSMAVSCSWTTVVSTWQGVQKSGGMGNDESLDRTWDTRVTLTKMYGLSMRIEPTVFCTTTRKGFFSSDNELSPDDGFAVVALIVGLNVMSLVDCALRIRALLVVRKEGGDVGFGVDGASNDSGDDVSLAPQGRQHSAQQDESDEGEDDRIDSNAAMIRPAVVNSSEWSNFLLRNKGKKWHMTAIVRL
ncbi:membrane-associated protein, putative [Bodo saltans]|uniref:Membrane-associated protein, putative n=1 Tax=Bodo saltans TaxID=75058 RepID=A0A0S4J642_BODSA|nr:membrane-associated protein, putative [Bodo saltans]|eukprot:CUG83871.1 membrane-associated protein, putative [Bodo saltans]